MFDTHVPPAPTRPWRASTRPEQATDAADPRLLSTASSLPAADVPFRNRLKSRPRARSTSGLHPWRLMPQAPQFARCSHSPKWSFLRLGSVDRERHTQSQQIQSIFAAAAWSLAQTHLHVTAVAVENRTKRSPQSLQLFHRKSETHPRSRNRRSRRLSRRVVDMLRTGRMRQRACRSGSACCFLQSIGFSGRFHPTALSAMQHAGSRPRGWHRESYARPAKRFRDICGQPAGSKIVHSLGRARAKCAKPDILCVHEHRDAGTPFNWWNSSLMSSIACINLFLWRATCFIGG